MLFPDIAPNRFLSQERQNDGNGKKAKKTSTFLPNISPPIETVSKPLTDRVVSYKRPREQEITEDPISTSPFKRHEIEEKKTIQLTDRPPGRQGVRKKESIFSSCQAASESNPFPALKSTPLVMLFSSVSLAPFSRNNRKRSFLKR